MTLIEQGADAADLTETTVTVNDGDSLAIMLPSNGGFVASLIRQ